MPLKFRKMALIFSAVYKPAPFWDGVNWKAEQEAFPVTNKMNAALQTLFKGV